MLALLRRPVAFPGSAGPRGGPSPSAAGTARLFDFGGGDTVLLLGEGDLSFTEALRGRSGRSGRGTPCIVASVQLGRRELLEAYPGSTLVQRLSRLEAAAAAGRSAAGGPLRLLYGLCATRLHLLGMPGCSVTKAGAAGATTAATNRRASSGPSSDGDASSSSSGGGGGDASSGGGSGGGSGSSPFRAGRATHIVFNFPHTGVDEDDDVHRRLMADFFASAGAALLAQGGRAQVRTEGRCTGGLAGRQGTGRLGWAAYWDGISVSNSPPLAPAQSFRPCAVHGGPMSFQGSRPPCHRL